MPNITYITFDQFHGFGHFVNQSHLVNGANITDNVIVLFENRTSVGGGGSADVGGYHFKSSTSIVFMILSWAFMLIGFTLCCCTQFFDKKKSTATEAGRPSADHDSGSESDEDFMRRIGMRRRDGRGGDRANHTEPNDIIRRYDIDLESLPSYTIVSGLPTYDDALEEFRKAGLILSPSIPVIKIFENLSIGKESSTDTTDTASTNADAASLHSTSNPCTCGAGASSTSNLSNIGTSQVGNQSIIELNPEHLHILSQKRLSLQIAFAAPRRNSRPRVDLYREVSRNNMLRAMDAEMFPQLHRSSSALTLNNERSLLEQRLGHHLQHRGSLT